LPEQPAAKHNVIAVIILGHVYLSVLLRRIIALLPVVEYGGAGEAEAPDAMAFTTAGGGGGAEEGGGGVGAMAKN
jgi:hypothetical protein